LISSFLLKDELIFSNLLILRLKLYWLLSIQSDISWLNKNLMRHFLDRSIADIKTLNRMDFALIQNRFVNIGFEGHLMNLWVIYLDLTVCAYRYLALFALKNWATDRLNWALTASYLMYSVMIQKFTYFLDLWGRNSACVFAWRAKLIFFFFQTGRAI